ncbi:porin family protein [Salmonella enterica subsp. enterica]|nr:porin family protein [Salmonella enterica subsp. enterica serovar Enteritidis]
MLKFARRAALAGVAIGLAFPAMAADLSEPMVVEAPEPGPAPVYQAPAEVGGWYLRGDVGYGWSDVDDIRYINYGDPGRYGKLTGDLKGSFSAGAGVGYQVNDHFRVDLTADHWFKRDFRGSSDGFRNGAAYTTVDSSSVSTWLLLANAYVDIGTWNGITPYVGAGIGGAHVKWDELHNDDIIHKGSGNWRFAAAVMAGASYCLTDRVKLDAGYRFSRIQGGKMFEYANIGNNGPGWDRGFNTHEVRAGLRYQFGGRSSDCAPAEVVSYEPAPVEPIYK